MSQTLYRKYRPQRFADVVDQNHIKITLQNEILSGQIAHAYLFTGPHGVGKTTLARILAKALNCQNRKTKEFEPCDKCSSCEEIVAGKSLDLIEIDAATHTQVDKVRENIVENINFAPHNKYKIFIIDEVHMLSTAAFNALLKTLEEPPAHAVFVLCTTQAYKLPETIISRCQRFDFKKVSAEQIADKLKMIIKQEKVKVADDVLSAIALRSGGFVRDAESLLGQVITILSGDKKAVSLEDVEAIIPRSDLGLIGELLDALINNNAQQGVEIINQLVTDGVDLERFNLDLIDYLRKMILIKVGLKNKDYNISGLPEAIENKLIAQSETVDMAKIIKMLETFMSKQLALKDAEITQLPLEMAVIEVTTNNQQSTTNNIAVNNSPQKTPSPTNNPAPTSQPTLQPAAVSIEIIKNTWPEIINQSQKINHSLPLILKTAYPVAVSGDTLELGFEFDIHIKKMQEEKCLASAEKVLQDVLSTKLKIKPVILSSEKVKEFKSSQTTSQSEINDEQLDEIANAFGGKVVE